MSEERARYDVLKPTPKGDTVSEMHHDFVDVRTRGGKLIFRLDASRMLVEWQEGRSSELIDLMPYLR